MHIRVYLTWRLSPRRPKGLTRRAGVFHLAMRAGAAGRAVAFYLAMRAGVAVRAVAFQLAMRAGVALHAEAFHLAMRAPLSLGHRVPLTRVPRRTPRVATASWPRASPCGSTTRILIREKKQSFGTRVCACSSRFRRFRDGPPRAAARARHARVGSVRVGFERLRGFYVP